MSHARSGALALTGPMPGTPAPLLIEAYACHAATMAVASVAIAAATSGANGGGSGGVAYGVSCPASLSLPVSSLQAVLLSTSAERAHRLAASPTLLMLPAADVLQVQAASLSDAPRPASSAGGGVAVGDTAHPGNSRLGSAAAPTAGPSEGSATDGSAVVSEEQATTTAKRGILGKPPLPTSATADPSALTPLPKRLTQLAPASGLPRVGSGSARRARPGPPPSGSGSLLVLQLGFFLSNARRQLSSMGILTDMNLVKALGAGGSSSVAGVASEGLDHWPERGAEPQRHWQLQLALSRPLVSPVLRQATEQLGFVGTSGAADMHGNKGQPGSTVNGSGRQAVPVGGAVSRQLPQLAALEAAAASSGHELLRSVVACIASVLVSEAMKDRASSWHCPPQLKGLKAFPALGGSSASHSPIGCVSHSPLHICTSGPCGAAGGHMRTKRLTSSRQGCTASHPRPATPVSVACGVDAVAARRWLPAPQSRQHIIA